MGAILRKYGVATTVIIPVIKAGSVDFSVTGDWTPVAGDVKISKDDGNVANIATLPVAVGGAGSALWKFSFSAGEMTASRVVIQVVDAATKAVEDQAIVLETYGNASAQHAFDLNLATQPVNMTQIDGLVTNGNNATLNLKQLNIINSAGTALIARSTGGGGIGIDADGDGSSSGIDATGGATGAGICVRGGVTSGDGINSSAQTEGDGIQATGAGAGQDVNGNLAGSIGSLGATAKTDVNAEVLDVMNTDTISELAQAVPSATPTHREALMLLYMALRNKLDTTNSTMEIHNDAGTVITKSALSDDGSTFTRAELVSGP